MAHTVRPRRHISVRIDITTVARLDALAVALCLPGREPSRTGAILAALHAGLPLVEREVATRRTNAGPLRA